MTFQIRSFATVAITALSFALVSASPARAETAVDPDVKAEDIPMQPLRDLNLDGEDLPPLLKDIGHDPYATAGLTSCHAIERGISDIDTMLGGDIDDPEERSEGQKNKNSAGRIASSIVGGLIPFRSIVREISGAKGEERRLRVLVNAAMVRRGFLKGIGLARECPWPARPIVDVEAARPLADLPAFPDPAKYRPEPAKTVLAAKVDPVAKSPALTNKTTAGGLPYVSIPVIQNAK